jgi:transketolase
VRSACIDELFDLAAADEKIMLVVGDLGFGVVTRYADELPRQFVNAGVAEQHMIGLAAGLAMSGKTAVTYTMAAFSIARCFEQIRNDVCYHNANVKIVAVGGGYAYGALGMTHHATEDIAAARALPNLTVIAPNDPIEARLATRAIIDHHGPCYLRLGRQGEANVHQTEPAFRIGQAIVVRPGNDITIAVSAGMLANAMTAAETLWRQSRIETRVLSVPTIKPLDVEALAAAAEQTGALFTLEEHSIVGGFGSAVAEVLLERDIRPRVFRRLGSADRFAPHVGDQNTLRALSELDADGIAKTIVSALRLAHA